MKTRWCKAVALAFVVFVASCKPSTEPQTTVSLETPDNVQLGPRPYWLVNAMEDSPLRRKLASCTDQRATRSDFSIGHRGAPLQFPEHTKESYVAAARQGAGIIECDVTFTRDRQLVCRHSQCDLHKTTNILATPLAGKCSLPFTPATNGKPAQARCCTSDITLAEFRSLHGKMDAANPEARTVAEYLDGTTPWRTNLYAGRGTLMSHMDSIALFKALGVKMMPELKAPMVPMPFQDGYHQAQFAKQMINEYRTAGVSPEDVHPQSFSLSDIQYWLEHEPQFAKKAVFLDGRFASKNTPLTPNNPASFLPSMSALAQAGVRTIAPPMWMLLSLDKGKIVASAYAREARGAGLDIIAWTLERSGPLTAGGGWYFQSVASAITDDGDVFEVLDVLATQVGTVGVFSDWPATTTFYANCMGIP